MASTKEVQQDSAAFAEGRPRRMALVLHASLWLLVAVAGVVLRGPVWDENYEFAQVLLDRVPYPEGHPEHFHVKNLFTLQLYQVALHMALGGGPEWVNGVRNVLFTLAKTVPFFFLGVFLSRRIMVGHVAALAALLLGGSSFSNVYPAAAWPVIPSNGMIGTGAVLFAVILLACGRWKSGFALVTAMPAIHIGQCPPLAIFSGLVLLHALWRRLPALRDIFIGIGLGTPVTLLSLAVAWHYHEGFSPEAAYVGTVDTDAVWRGFLTTITDHQRLRVGPDLLAMLWTLWLLVICWWEARGTENGRAFAWLLLYSAIVCGIVWSIMCVHATMGEDTPHALLFWIPYRLANHLPPLMAAVLAVVLLARTGPDDSVFRSALVLLLAGFTLSLLDVYQERVLTGVSGAAIVLLAWRLRPLPIAIGWGVVSLALWLVCLYALEMPMQPFYYGLGAGVFALMLDHTRLKLLYQQPLVAKAAAALVLLLVLASTFRPSYGPPDLVVVGTMEAEFERLEAAGEMHPNEMICVPHIQRTLQGRLDHPVIAEIATLTWIPYHRELGPGMHRLFQDLYGIDLTHATDDSNYTYPPTGDWTNVWEARSEDEWRRLGDRYDFRYVISSAMVPLQLEEVFTEGMLTLYRVPGMKMAKAITSRSTFGFVVQ